MELRRIAFRGLVAAPLVAGVGLGVFVWLPKLVRERIAARAAERSGLQVEAGDVSLGFTSVKLSGLSARGAGGLELRASQIEVDANPLWLALRGTRAISGVRVQEVAARVPLEASSTRALIARLRARKPQTDEHKEAGVPELRIGRARLALSDEQGSLVRVDGASATLDARGAELGIEHVAFGQAPATTLELERVALSARRSADGLRLARVRVPSARARLGAQPVSASGKPAPEVDDSEDASADTDADDGAKSAHDRPAAAPRPRGVVRRLLSALEPAQKQNSAQTQPGGKQPASVQRSLLDRLTDDALISLEDASVVDGANGVVILESLSATLKVQKGRALSLVGSGKAQRAGIIRCDLVVRPDELRADGQVQLRALPLPLLVPFLPGVPWFEPERGRVDAELVIKTEPAQGVVFSGEASLRDAAISSERIAPTPVLGIDVSLNGRGRFLPLAHRLEIAEAEVALRGTALQVSGALEWSADHYLFDIDATLPKTPCTKAVRSIPEDLLGDMAVASWQGKIGGHLRVKLDSRALDDAVLEIAPEDRCEFVTVPALADLRRFRMPFIHSVEEPDGTLFEMETGPGTSNWTFLEDINPFFVHAVLAHEDAGFFSHHGFSPRHIRDALVRNLKEGRYVVGASTITMQLVKNVFLHREKTLARKIQEVLLTWWIERVMEKRDILELYLNVIEYGPSVYGIRNAAKHYFSRLPSQLSPAESIFLATILPNPKRYHSMFERGALSAGWIDQMRKMLQRMKAREWYTPEAVDYGLKELTDFHFAPEGTIVAPRQIPGSAAPLPYMQAFSDQPGWGDDADSGPAKQSAPARPKTDPKPVLGPKPAPPEHGALRSRVTL